MIWYSALLLALAAIATSAQQSVALTRLGSHSDGLCKIRQLIGKRDGLTKFKARKLQLFIWQAPLSLLNTSVVMFIIGFAVLVWKAALPISSGDNVKVKPHTNQRDRRVLIYNRCWSSLCSRFPTLLVYI
jgi:hypothetical protein